MSKDTSEPANNPNSEIIPGKQITITLPEKIPNRRPTKNFSDDVKILAKIKYAQGETIEAIAADLNCATGSVWQWINKFNVDIVENNDLCESLKNQMALKFLSLSHRIAARVTDKDIDTASLQQKTISSATWFDKYRLASEQTTENVGMLVGKTDDITLRADQFKGEADVLQAELTDLEQSTLDIPSIDESLTLGTTDPDAVIPPPTEP